MDIGRPEHEIEASPQVEPVPQREQQQPSPERERTEQETPDAVPA